MINEAISLGVTDIGENKVQEIEEKYDKIVGDVKWHMIGHLQTNKVKYIIDKVSLIHSLDRKSLAEEIQKRAEQSGIVAEVLVQVNVAEEETKFGLKVEETLPFIESLSKLKNVKVMANDYQIALEEGANLIRVGTGIFGERVYK